MDFDAEIKEEIKIEGEEDITVTNLYFPPLTLDGPPTVWNIKEEEVETTVSGEEMRKLYRSESSQETNWNSDRPKRGQHPKRFHDEIYIISPKKAKIAESPPIKSPPRSVQFSNNTSTVTNVRHLEHETITLLSKPTREREKDPPFKPKISVLKPSSINSKLPSVVVNSTNFETGKNKPVNNYRVLKHKSFQSAKNKDSESNFYNTNKSMARFNAMGDEEVPINPPSVYKRRVPDDYYRAKFKLKPCYVAIHNILLTLIQDDATKVLNINIGACKTCKFLQSKRVCFRGTEMVKMLEITCKPIQDSTHISAVINVNGEVFDYVLSQRSFTHFIREINVRLLRNLPTKITGQLKLRLPEDFNWKECLPEWAYVTPALRNNIIQSFTCTENEVVVKTPIITSINSQQPGLFNLSLNKGKKPEDASSEESASNINENNKEMIFKVNKLRCCIHCSQVFRNEQTHKCPGQVLLVLPPPSPANKIEAMPLPTSTVMPKIQSKILTNDKSTELPLTHNYKKTFTKKEEGTICKFCSKTITNKIHRCENNLHCTLCSEKYTQGVMHFCKSDKGFCNYCQGLCKGTHKSLADNTKKQDCNKVDLTINDKKVCNSCNQVCSNDHNCVVSSNLHGSEEIPVLEQSYCNTCKLNYTGIHKCENNERCRLCSEKIVIGNPHTCPSNNVSENKTVGEANPVISSNLNALEALYCCLLCSKSYKYEVSVLKHICVPMDKDACRKCLKKSMNSIEHGCVGFAKCPKCLSVVTPKEISRHLCRTLKYCSYCEHVLHGTAVDCTITNCRTLNKCKVCDGNTKPNETHTCRNLIKCKKCQVLYKQTTTHKCSVESNLPKCNLCLENIISNDSHVCKVKCLKCNVAYFKDVLHICSSTKTCEFCNSQYDGNNVHKCTANMCKFCKTIVLFDDIATHKCHLENVTCLFCKATMPKSEKHKHKCASNSHCSICQLPIAGDTKHSCKKCPFCKAVFNKTHICFAKSGKKNVLTHDISNIPKEIAPKPEKEKPEVVSKHIYNCSSCKMTTKLKTEFLKHSCVKKVDEVFLCNGCPKMFSKLEFLEKHQLTMCPKRKSENKEETPDNLAKVLETKIQGIKKNTSTRRAGAKKLEIKINTPAKVIASKRKEIETNKAENSNKVIIESVSSQTSTDNNISQNVIVESTDNNLVGELNSSDDLIAQIASSEVNQSIDKIEPSLNDDCNISLTESSKRPLSLPCLMDGNLQFDDAVEEVSSIDWEELNI